MKSLREMMDLVAGKINENFNMDNLGAVECPKCHHNDLSWEEDAQVVNCRGCGTNFDETGKEI
jgi:ribosomal protein S27E